MLMKEKARGEYFAPEIDVIVIKAEQGFAQSGSTEGFEGQNGGW
jgi:hypothetical protein